MKKAYPEYGKANLCNTKNKKGGKKWKANYPLWD